MIDSIASDFEWISQDILKRKVFLLRTVLSTDIHYDVEMIEVISRILNCSLIINCLKSNHSE